MKTVNIAFGIHNHQPVGNFDFVFEEAYEKAYLPFLELLEKHPRIRMAQHYTGILFDWIKEHKAEFIPRLRKLVESGQIEMMTGGFYEPIMSVIPYRDKVGQINKLTDYVRQHTGYDPVGMWLAERIWEPQLPKPMHAAGVRYVVLDDSHFKSAGLQDRELHGYYITEEDGATIYLFPTNEKLRYTIPFQPPRDTIDYLREVASDDQDALIVFADDGEKFGVWPGTHKHCYEDGWLEQFFRLIEENVDWIKILHFSEALQQLKPLGRIYLPTAAYREMMEWAMPTKAIHAFEEFEERLKQQDLHEKYKVFVRGGFWRNFMAKYPEANNMHKKMLSLSERLAALETSHGSEDQFKKAQEHVWAGQCNCPYWHGVFGGLYLNHLRFATYREFIQAEQALDKLERGPEYENAWVDHQEFDYDCDGQVEIVLKNRMLNLYLAPDRGGALFELDFKPAAINLLDTITRREESYHRKLLQAPPEQEQHKEDSIPSIHELAIAKEEGLRERLFYDFYRRSSFIEHFLPPETTLTQFEQSKFEEAGDFLESDFEHVVEKKNGEVVVKLWRDGRVNFGTENAAVHLMKKLRLSGHDSRIVFDYEIRNQDASSRTFWFGSEFDFALLAGDAPDRYYEIPGQKLEDSRLRSKGEIQECSAISLIDEWLGLRLTLKMHTPASVWRFPIETISQSEGGFERVYQSSVVFPNWRFSLDPGQAWKNELILEIESLQ